MAAKIFNLSRFVYKSSLSSLKVSSVCLYPIRKYWERNIWIRGHRNSQPEVDFTNFFLLTLDIYNVYNMCKIEVKNFIHWRDIWLWKWNNEKFFFKITGSWRLNFRWGKLYMIFQRELNKVVWVLIGKKKIENYDFFVTSGDDRKWRRKYLSQ